MTKLTILRMYADRIDKQATLMRTLEYQTKLRKQLKDDLRNGEDPELFDPEDEYRLIEKNDEQQIHI